MVPDMMNEKELETAARVMHALAHPLRLGIMQALSQEEMTVTQLYEQLNCSQSMMSQQLRILDEQGLVATRKEGTTKYCSIRNEDFLNLFHCMEKHLEMFFKVEQ